MYRPQKQSYELAIWRFAAVCGPALEPLVGGFAAKLKDGRGLYGS